jgi:hypothetical protein
MITSIWINPFFYLFVTTLLLLIGVTCYYLSKLNKKTSESKLSQQQYAARIDVLRKEHTEKLEMLRIEMLKREEDRSRQWMESERETLRVLNGVSSLLDLNKRLGRIDSDKIMEKLKEIQNKIENLENNK